MSTRGQSDSQAARPRSEKSRVSGATIARKIVGTHARHAARRTTGAILRSKYRLIERNVSPASCERTDKNVGIDFAENIRVGVAGRTRGNEVRGEECHAYQRRPRRHQPFAPNGRDAPPTFRRRRPSSAKQKSRSSHISCIRREPARMDRRWTIGWKRSASSRPARLAIRRRAAVKGCATGFKESSAGL